MNKHKFLAAAIGAMIFASACKKSDVQPNAVNAPAPAEVSTASFTSLNNWSEQPQENSTLYTSKIENGNINSEVASEGMVLVFKKSGNDVTALPAEEKDAYFWYYQVSEGNLQINAEASGTTKAPGADQSFSYFVISPEKLIELESKGYKKAQLMTLTYETAAALLK